MLDEELAGWVLARERYTPSAVALRALDEVAFRPGRRPVIVTAAHATAQRRDGLHKPAESESGALADALGEIAGYASLTMIGPQTGDANWDISHPFRDRIDMLVARYGVVLDLHMMLDTHGPDICLGLGPNPDSRTGRFAALAAHEAELCGLRCSINWPFGATPRTLTAYVQRGSASALQIELAARTQQLVTDPRLARQLLRWWSHVDRHVAAMWG
ncbi:MAG TPA: hypothetical protein VGO80_12985 [Solirubrobacteraceae bacterium]|nr:hypothetical protein [Solirubrobacteraceae bacterium]